MRLIVIASPILAGLFLAFIPPSYGETGKAPQYKQLEQRQKMVGKFTFFMGPDAAKAVTTHFTFLFLNKEGAILFVNEQSRKYCRLTKDECEKRFHFYTKESDMMRQRQSPQDKDFTPYSRFKKMDVGNIAGLHVTRYTRFRTNNLPPPYDKLYTEQVWFTKDVAIPIEIFMPFSQIVHMPLQDNLGTPLRMREIREWNGKKRKLDEITLDTIAYHKTSKPPISFTLPKGYNRVKDEMTVMIDEEGEGMTGLIGDYKPKTNASLNPGEKKR